MYPKTLSHPQLLKLSKNYLPKSACTQEHSLVQQMAETTSKKLLGVHGPYAYLQLNADLNSVNFGRTAIIFIGDIGDNKNAFVKKLSCQGASRATDQWGVQLFTLSSTLEQKKNKMGGMISSICTYVSSDFIDLITDSI